MPKPITPGERCYHLDAARTLLMLLGIPYHAALLFQDEIEWATSAGVSSAAAKSIVATIHIFRMPAFFLLSGYLAAMILTRTDASAWLRKRFLDLGIPLLFALVTLHPFQVFVPALFKGAPLTNLMQGQSVGHLWFLIALLGISSIALRARGSIAKADAISVSVLTVGAYASVAVAIAIATITRESLATHYFPFRNTVVVVSWGIGSGLPYFLLGMVMSRRHDLARKLTLYRPAAYLGLLLSVGTYVAIMPLQVDTMASTIAGGLLAIPLTTTLILFCSRYLDRQSRIIGILTKSSFTVYLVHHPIIVLFGAATAGAAVPWFLHYTLICAATWLTSFGLWYVIRHTPVLRVLLGAKAVKNWRWPSWVSNSVTSFRMPSR